jgi:hypothetical protein
MVLMPSLAASLALVTPEPSAGQPPGARPASIALTVIVPPRVPASPTTVEQATVLRQSESALDIQATVGVATGVASRIEVGLAAAWPADSTRVLVQNPKGELEALGVGTRIIAATAPVPGEHSRSFVRFRLESEQPLSAATVSVPIEYRITVGHGERITVWSFPAFLYVGGGER